MSDDLEKIRTKKRDDALKKILLDCFDQGVFQEKGANISRLWASQGALAAVKERLGEEPDGQWLGYHKKIVRGMDGKQ